jgi:hypothetical protein
MSPVGPERRLLRDSNTSGIGGQSGSVRRVLKMSLMTLCGSHKGKTLWPWRVGSLPSGNSLAAPDLAVALRARKGPGITRLAVQRDKCEVFAPLLPGMWGPGNCRGAADEPAGAFGPKAIACRGCIDVNNECGAGKSTGEDMYGVGD